MRVIYAPEPLNDLGDHSVFLAGPTPRRAEVSSWRPEAIRLFSEAGYTGTLLAPEPGDGQFSAAYEDQIEWEHEGMRRADVVLFWVPRSVSGQMPAFTTNVEFGLCLASGKEVVYGRPDWAEKCKYLDLLYDKMRGRTPTRELSELVSQVVAAA